MWGMRYESICRSLLCMLCDVCIVLGVDKIDVHDLWAVLGSTDVLRFVGCFGVENN